MAKLSSCAASQRTASQRTNDLFELQAWLGHRSPETTQHYACITPTRLAKAYRDASYFVRNVRTVEVLITAMRCRTEARRRAHHGSTSISDMASARTASLSSAYIGWHAPAVISICRRIPREPNLLDAQNNLQRMLAQIPLTDDERRAVEDGAAAVVRLIERLTDVPTPTGLTPRQLTQSTNFIPFGRFACPHHNVSIRHGVWFGICGHSVYFVSTIGRTCSRPAQSEPLS